MQDTEVVEHALGTHWIGGVPRIERSELRRLFLHGAIADVSWNRIGSRKPNGVQTGQIDNRAQKARQLLRQTDMSVLDVSLACGFESPSYFTRSYRARFACAPRQDRVG